MRNIHHHAVNSSDSTTIIVLLSVALFLIIYFLIASYPARVARRRGLDWDYSAVTWFCILSVCFFGMGLVAWTAFVIIAYTQQPRRNEELVNKAMLRDLEHKIRMSSSSPVI